MHIKNWAFGILCFVLPMFAQQVVRTDGGQVSGAAGKNAAIQVYKGIPYAAPPVGDLRWKEPQPAAAWQGVKPAVEFGAECMQAPYPEGSMYYNPPRPVSEDCLTLNVWTGAKSAREHRPVMVWIHGGAFTRGSGATPTYDGEVLAAKGVVVVTINYRLGVFGFLAHPELTAESPHHASGNYALLDQIAALKWVQQNIAAFGGDSKRVTIFGESAGSWAVNLLMASPLAAGLFQRVIGESGANFSRHMMLADAEQNGTRFGTRISASTLAALRAKTADELLKAGGGFQACIDGYFLPADVHTIFEQGKQNDVPLIAGYNQDEGTTLAPWPASGTAKSFTDQAKLRYTKLIDDFLKVYPANSDAQAQQSYYDAFRDSTFGWEMRTWARMQTKTGRSPAYQYFFKRIATDRIKYRAYHASEIQYVFGTLAPSRTWEDADRQLSAAMSSYWVNFATTGDPNGKGLPKWPAYKTAEDPAIVFGDKIEVGHDVNKPGLDFMDRYFESLRTPRSGATNEHE